MGKEEAKAVQELAKVTGKGIGAAREFGRFLGRVIGGSAVQAGGILEDWLTYKRKVLHLQWARLYRIKVRVEEELNTRGVDGPTRPVAPKLAFPILEEAAFEDDDELQDIWARLLATAMDPNAPQIKRAYIHILKSFEPSDAVLLEDLYRITFERDSFAEPYRLGMGGFTFPITELSTHLNMTGEECEISLLNLDQVGCITLVLHRAITKEDTSYPPLDQVAIHLTALGKALVEACMK